uniref:BTB domain-containing protein n=1 Tax=Romanomermis culicivorax TaxID=13658 RepID=A0A915HHQ6_ROMCU
MEQSFTSKQSSPSTPMESITFSNKDNMQRCFQALNNFRRNDLFCDVILIAGQSPEEQTEADFQPGFERLEISAHRAVLAACCPYFYAMFTVDMAESNQKEIYIQGINPKALSMLVDYIYTSSLQISEENVQVLV